MRKTLTGTVRVASSVLDTLTIHVGALNAEERYRFEGATVEISVVDTAESLLEETFKVLNEILGRNVVRPDRDVKLQDIRDRARSKGIKVGS